MRIVLVNWARIWDGASFGGGVNGYCQSLALALLKRGHDVVSLFGGTAFIPNPTPDKTSPCVIRRHDDWLGVRVFEVINSPVMAPSIVQYQDPMGEVSSPELEAEVSRLLSLLKPDVVHFHNIEGFSIGCVAAARSAGARVIYSLHNYHTICPQVYLMQGHRRVCHSYDNGHSCVGCIETRPPALERVRRAEQFLEIRREEEESGEAEPNQLAQLERDLAGEWGGLKHEFSWPVRVVKRSLRLWRLRDEIRRARAARVAETLLPGHAFDSPESVQRPLEVPPPTRPRKKTVALDHQVVERPVSHDHRGQTQGILDELYWKPPTQDAAAPERRPLLNVITPEPPSTKPPNDYARRRAAMVSMLSSCDRVLAVSKFVREKFVSMGVNPNVIDVLSLGSRINRVVERNRELVFDPPPFVRPAPGEPAPPQRPVRLIFMGYNNLYKGLHVFADALESFGTADLARIDLSVFALDGQSIEWRFRRLEPRLARLVFVHGYQFQDIPWMLGGKDLGVVPSVWWDNAPQTVFEFFSCRVPVLGAAVGGIPDFVTDNVNGLLFEGNNPADLARRLIEVLNEPWRLTAMRANVRPPKDIDDHVLELEQVYARDVR